MGCEYCDADVDGGCRAAVRASDCLRGQLSTSRERLRVALTAARAEKRLREDIERRCFAMDARAQEAGEFYENAGNGEPIPKREAMAVAWASVLRPYLVGLRDHYDKQSRPARDATVCSSEGWPEK